MNKSRRKRLTSVVNSLEELSEDTERVKVETTLQESQEEVELIADEEQEAIDMLPENLQFSQRADDMNDNVFDLQDASAELETALAEYQENDRTTFNDIEDSVNSAVGSINNAIDR